MVARKKILKPPCFRKAAFDFNTPLHAVVSAGHKRALRRVLRSLQSKIPILRRVAQVYITKNYNRAEYSAASLGCPRVPVSLHHNERGIMSVEPSHV